MSTQVVKGSNGTAPKANGQAKEVATVVNLLPAKEEKAREEKPKSQTAELPPLEDRLYRLDQLLLLQKQYLKLQESLQKLSQFEVKTDGETASLTLRDDNRNDFTTYHPSIINEVIDFLKVKIKEKMKSLEPKLTW